MVETHEGRKIMTGSEVSFMYSDLCNTRKEVYFYVRDCLGCMKFCPVPRVLTELTNPRNIDRLLVVEVMTDRLNRTWINIEGSV